MRVCFLGVHLLECVQNTTSLNHPFSLRSVFVHFKVQAFHHGEILRLLFEIKPAYKIPKTNRLKVGSPEGSCYRDV